ncbi:multiheme c-type cytochrome [Candidatus Nitrospira allomarina]|uniref:Multiheme c-type cytochrome n=1 Tax=Candidatus Nitrospira allomarina TaxID=3020900 RepID=A0AA96JZ03_9BACT|nr:multiheme c-type cytochrome [Candidatus Nitrospira allomarina]WNM58094.1 multiheme c-type cytochrome [Candidatus Nitrospira allomarina]
MNRLFLICKKNLALFLGVMVICGILVINVMASFNQIILREALAGNNSSVPDKPLEKAFPPSNKCQRCHLRAFEEWESSAQSRSIETAPFRVTLDRYLQRATTDQQKMCFQCHAPHILKYGHLFQDFVEEVKSKDPQIDGVGCSQCHLISEVDSSTRPPHPIFSLGKTLFGGYDNPQHNLAHDSQKLELYTQSQYCVPCHQSLPSHNGAITHSDWLGSWQETKAEQNGKTCQACHMPEAFGESATGEPSRRIANHSFPGRFGKVRANAVELQFTTHVKGQVSQVEVTIHSLVPHNLPLPHPGWSRIVLDLTILGKNLNKVYGEQRFYERIYIDPEGAQTVFDFEAVKILKDTSLKPEEKRVEKFSFPTPANAPSMDVIVTMSYAPVHGSDDFLKAIEDEATLGRKDRSFQKVLIKEERANVPISS